MGEPEAAGVEAVSPSPAVEVPAASDRAEAPPKPPSGYLRLRGLPYSASDADIKDFFGAANYSLLQVFICKRNGRSTGEAYIQLSDAAQSAQALAELHKKHLGARYIEVFEAQEADLQTAKALSLDRMRGFVVRLRGLPYNASANEVLKFFDGVEVVRGIEGVIFTWTPDGRPTGEAFVELQDEGGQREAMKRHKELMGNRYIELFTSTKADLIQAIQHNRLILGFANRKRWLQQAGLAAHMGGPGAMARDGLVGGGMMGHQAMGYQGMGQQGPRGMGMQQQAYGGGGMGMLGGRQELDGLFGGMSLNGRGGGRGGRGGGRGAPMQGMPGGMRGPQQQGLGAGPHRGMPSGMGMGMGMGGGGRGGMHTMGNRGAGGAANMVGNVRAAAPNMGGYAQQQQVGVAGGYTLQQAAGGVGRAGQAVLVQPQQFLIQQQVASGMGQATAGLQYDASGAAYAPVTTISVPQQYAQAGEQYAYAAQHGAQQQYISGAPGTYTFAIMGGANGGGLGDLSAMQGAIDMSAASHAAHHLPLDVSGLSGVDGSGVVLQQ